MSKEYLNLSQADDLKDSKEKLIYRFFEILPGLLSWGTLLASFILSWLAPVVVALFIIVFDVYWLLRISYLSAHQISCYRRMKKNLKVDWLKKLEDEKGWEEIYHLIILPFYKEDISIVREGINSLIDSDYPEDKMIVVLTGEERAGEPARVLIKEIEEEFGRRFFRFISTVHPKDIAGEIAGKGSNAAWGVKKAKEVINYLNIPYEKVIVSSFDIDTRVYPRYFSCLTWNYLNTENPTRASYQPIPVYNNNIWLTPAFSRVIASSGTFWQMMQQERPEQLITFSSHSMSLSVFNEVEYPVNLMSINDDSHIFWKAYFYYDGDYRVIPLYYPVSMDAVAAKTAVKTAFNQYRQQRRWAFGCSEIPFIFYGFLKNKKIALKDKIRHSLILLDGFWSWATSALLIFFLGWLPLMLGGDAFQATMLSYGLPKITSYIMTLAMIGMVISAILSLKILPSRPKGLSGWKRLSMVLQWALLPVTLIIFGNFPALEAQLRMMLGKGLGHFWVTEKIRKG